MLKTLDIFVILLTLVLLVSGLRRRIRLWTVGRAFDSEGVNWKKIKSLLVEGVAHRRILRDKYPGFLHLFLFLGFIFPLFPWGCFFSGAPSPVHRDWTTGRKTWLFFSSCWPSLAPDC
jgi:hypothetical protein